MAESYKSSDESPDDVMGKKFASFIDEGGYTADEVREAYYRLCGVVEDENSSEQVTTLLNEMERLTRAQFPLNRLILFIRGVEIWEDSVKKFEGYVSTLAISDKEKSILKSIVSESREGDLECHIDGTPVIKMKIVENNSKEGAALALMAKLKEISNKMEKGQLSIWFEEK